MRSWLMIGTFLLAAGAHSTALAQVPPPQPYPYQPYPPAPAPGPAPYAQPYPGQPGAQPGAPTGPYPYGLPANQQPVSKYRGGGELLYLLGTGAAYGIGSGVWIDALAETKDPGLSVIAPLAFGVGVPLGLFFWDDFSKFHRGVPSSMATGILLGSLEGMAIAGMQSTMSNNGWSFKGQSTMTWVAATGGAVGGYFFGEWLRPDPRSLSFIASTSGMAALSGAALGAGVIPRRGPTEGRADGVDYLSVGGFIGFNSGLLTSGALTFAGVTPSYQTQKYMWLGYGAGSLLMSFVYVFYLFSDAPVWHGLIANSLGGIGGATLAGILTADLKDDPTTGKAFKPPFFFGASPAQGGGMLSVGGQF